jgi:hypothetical protein
MLDASGGAFARQAGMIRDLRHRLQSNVDVRSVFKTARRRSIPIPQSIRWPLDERPMRSTASLPSGKPSRKRRRRRARERREAGSMTKVIQPKKGPSSGIVSLKVTLRGTRPPVWRRLLIIEKRAPSLEPACYPACVAGKRNCPPEDCGGPWGYEDLLAVLADPAHPEHAERSEWLGEEFDPDEFAIEIANATLAARFHRK